MGSTLTMAVYIPVVVAGLVLVIMWGMSAAGKRTLEIHLTDEASSVMSLSLYRFIKRAGHLRRWPCRVYSEHGAPLMYRSSPLTMSDI